MVFLILLLIPELSLQVINLTVGLQLAGIEWVALLEVLQKLIFTIFSQTMIQLILQLLHSNFLRQLVPEQ